MVIKPLNIVCLPGADYVIRQASFKPAITNEVNDGMDD